MTIKQFIAACDRIKVELLSEAPRREKLRLAAIATVDDLREQIIMARTAEELSLLEYELQQVEPAFHRAIAALG